MSAQSRLDDMVPKGEKVIHVGDHVTDREDRDRKMVVTGVPPGMTADEYEFKAHGSMKTVAEVNEDYPASDQVVEVKFVAKDKAYLPKEKYAYPESRLEVVNSLHSAEDES